VSEAAVVTPSVPEEGRAEDRLPGVRAPVTESMTTRDGVRLDATVWRPEGEGPWPALFMRQPYGRDIASTVTLAHPSWYAARGYVVVVQDVRGTGTSEGTFRVLAHEAAVDRVWEETIVRLVSEARGDGRAGAAPDAAADRTARWFGAALMGVLRTTVRDWFEHDTETNLVETGLEAMERLVDPLDARGERNQERQR